MKNRRVILIFIMFGLLFFLFHWYIWDLIDFFTLFLIFVPVAIISVIAAVFLIYSIVYAVRNTKELKLKAYVPLIIVVLSILLPLFFPFTEAALNLDFNLNFNARNEVVQLMKTGALKPEGNNENLIVLPEKFKKLSKGGGEVAIERIEGHDIYFFFTFRGVLDHYSDFAYDSDENAQKELGKGYFEVIKLSDAWYYCSFR